MAAAPVRDSGPAAKEARSDNRPGPLTEPPERAAQGGAEADPVGAGLAERGRRRPAGRRQVLRGDRDRHGSGLHDPVRVRRPGQRQARPRPRPAAQRDPRARPRPSTTARTGVRDFDQDYYEDLFFGSGESFADFYTKQSSGHLHGRGLGQRLGHRCPATRRPTATTPSRTSAAPGSSSRTPATPGTTRRSPPAARPTDIKAELATFDVWDRYDYDDDGDFDEPDGYVDHFQAVHAGEGEDAGGGARAKTPSGRTAGTSTPTDYGPTGPRRRREVFFGGAQIGDTGYWIGDYTVEAENGGLGVFAHEYGHDLGLPDLYDTAGGENGTGFWTLMSSGSWMNRGGDDIGTTPNYMGRGRSSSSAGSTTRSSPRARAATFTLSPAALAGRRPGAGTRRRCARRGHRDHVRDAVLGRNAWWTSSADDLNTTLTRSARPDRRVKSATVTAKAWYDIEAGLRLPLRASTRRTTVRTGRTIGDPLDGSSNGKWSNLEYTVPGGDATLFRFRYQTRRWRAPAGRVHRRHHAQERRHDAAHRRRRGRRQRLDRRRRLQAQHRHRDRDRRSLLPRREPHVRRLRRDTRRRARTSSASRSRHPTRWSTSRTRTACSSGRSTRRMATTTRSSTRATAWRFRSTRGPRRSATKTGSAGRATAASRSTRPSGCRPPTPSPSTRRSSSGKGKNQTVELVAAPAPSNPGIPTFNDADEDAYFGGQPARRRSSPATAWRSRSPTRTRAAR